MISKAIKIVQTIFTLLFEHKKFLFFVITLIFIIIQVILNNIIKRNSQIPNTNNKTENEP